MIAGFDSRSACTEQNVVMKYPDSIVSIVFMSRLLVSHLTYRDKWKTTEVLDCHLHVPLFGSLLVRTAVNTRYKVI